MKKKIIVAVFIFALFLLCLNIISKAENENSYIAGDLIEHTEQNYNNLKNLINSDTNKNNSNAFDVDIDTLKKDLGLGFNFGNELDWTSNQNSHKRSYKVRFSIGYNDTEYYYYETYVSQDGNLFYQSNKPTYEQEYSEFVLEKAEGINLEDTSLINYLKLDVLNEYEEAQNRDLIVDLSYLDVKDKEGNSVIIDNSILKKYTVRLNNNRANVLKIDLNTTNGEFFGDNTRLRTSVQLDKFISDFKNNPKLIYEDTYNGVVATDEELEFLKEQGFKTIRLPITWYNHMNSAGTVDPEWFEEINEVVDRILSHGFYVVIDIHHDTGKDGWIRADENLFAEYEYKYKYLILQIANNFKNYDEHLILEGPSEVLNYKNSLIDNLSDKDFETVNRLSQIFVDEVRRTGYNNTNRPLLINTLGAYYGNLSNFVLPNDTVDNKIFVGIHDYTIRADGTLAFLEYLLDNGSEYLNKYNFIIGEFGIERTKELNTKLKLMERSAYICYMLDIPMIVWDDGGGYAIMKKNAAEWDENYNSDKVAQALINAYLKGNAPLENENTKEIIVEKKWNDENNKLLSRPNNITVYLKEAPITMFKDGSFINSKMKKLAGTGVDVNTVNNNIYAIKRSDNLKENLTNDNIVSTNSSEYPVYMWFEDNTIYYYTEAPIVYLNTLSTYMFSNLQELKDIDELKNFNTSKTTDIAFMFQNCISIEDISALSNWDVSCVKRLKQTFFVSNSLVNSGKTMKIKSLKPLSNWDTSSVNTLDQAFKGCANIHSLEGLENWDVSNVTTLQSIFQSCALLEDYDSIKYIENWNVRSVSNFNNMFSASPARNSSEFFFTLRQGSINSNNGTYTTNVASTPKPYEPKVSPIRYFKSKNWEKKNDTWICRFYVPNDNAVYNVYEDEVKNYSSDALFEHQKTITDGSITITNTLLTKDIKITVNWKDKTNMYHTRPKDVEMHLVSKDGTKDYTMKDFTELDDNTWEYTFTVVDDSSKYSAYLEDINNYKLDATKNKSVDVIDNSATITSLLDINKYDIKIEKNIESEVDLYNQTFKYNIKILGMDNEQVIGNIFVTDISGSRDIESTQNGFTLELKSGQELIIHNIPEGCKYIIEEQLTKYKTNYEVLSTEKNSILIERTSGRIVENTINENQTIIYTTIDEALTIIDIIEEQGKTSNLIPKEEKKEEQVIDTVPITGLFINNSPFVIIITTSAVLICLYTRIYFIKNFKNKE